jgi:peptidoglycan/xylan/chitin deacetylase (PgdA/CDA1 family)
MSPRSLEALVVGGLSLLAGCATPPPPAPPAPPAPVITSDVLARNNDFVVVMARPGDDFAGLAKRFLGDPRRAWWIAEFNGMRQPKPGVDVVIPLKGSLLNSVDPKGVRTITILCYHRFNDGRSKLSLSAREFTEQMEYLAANDYHVVALRELPAMLRGEVPMPPRAVAISIDDGYRSMVEVAYPILQRYGFPATLFLYSDLAGLPAGLTWAQMKDMMASGLIDVQPHSKSHGNLALRQADESEQRYAERVRQEIEVPSTEIERRLGQAIYGFAYPYGDATETVTDQIKRRNIEIAFTVSPGGNPFFAYPLLLRRTMIFGDDGLTGFRNKLAVFAPNGVH